MNKLNHIAFIMDGNGRWGKKKNKGRNFGHIKGVDAVKKIVETSIKFKIPIITFFVFSSENWKRPRKEINFLFKLIKLYFLKEIKVLVKQGIKINILGNLSKLSSDVRLILKKTINLTKNNKKLVVNLAINYGAKYEILNAIKKNKKKVNIKNIEKNLYTSKLPDPDILIRTGGYQRLSNFMLWQLAYTELFFVKKLWPDFNNFDLLKIIRKFKKTKRNFGRI
jgi:undecaprenyl diphosphate synthase